MIVFADVLYALLWGGVTFFWLYGVACWLERVNPIGDDS